MQGRNKAISRAGGLQGGAKRNPLASKKKLRVAEADVAGVRAAGSSAA